jgi:hypothetical protein
MRSMTKSFNVQLWIHQVNEESYHMNMERGAWSVEREWGAGISPFLAECWVIYWVFFKEIPMTVDKGTFSTWLFLGYAYDHGPKMMEYGQKIAI